MATAKSGQNSFFHLVNSQSEWREILDTETSLIIADIYHKWCGPCTTFEVALDKFQTELKISEAPVKFYGVERSLIGTFVDKIATNSCKPVLGYFSRKDLIKCTYGINTPDIVETIKSLIVVHESQAEFEQTHQTTNGDQTGKDSSAALKGDSADSEEACQEKEAEQFIILLKPDVVMDGKKDEILENLKKSGVSILNTEERMMEKSEIEQFYAHHKESDFFASLVEFMQSGPVCVVLISTTDFNSLRELIGPTDSKQAKELAPNSFRAIFGTDQLKNGVHCSDSRQMAQKEIQIFFPDSNSAHKVESNQESKIESNKPGKSMPRMLLCLNVSRDSRESVEASISNFIPKESVGFGAYKFLGLDELNKLNILSKLCPVDVLGGALSFLTEQIVERLSIVNTDILAVEVFGPSFDAIKSFINRFSELNLNVNKDGMYSAMQDVAEELLMNVFGSDEKTLAMIKPEAFDKRSELIDKVKQKGFIIEGIREKTLTEKECRQIYARNQEMPYFQELIQNLQTGPSIIMILKGKCAVKRWREMLGPVDPEQAQNNSPNSLRAFAGKNTLLNGLHGSSSVVEENLQTMLLEANDAQEVGE